VDIEIPSLASFVHNVYTNCARKIYTNVYLFETDIPSLQVQKNNRELETIIRECIMNTVRESVPTEKILRAYMDETVEEDVETKEELVKVECDGEDAEVGSNEEVKPLDKSTVEQSSGSNTETNPESARNKNEDEVSVNGVMKADELAASLTVDTEDNDTSNGVSLTSTQASKLEAELEDVEKPAGLKFNDSDEAISVEGVKEVIDAPKDIDTLEHISEVNFAKRKAEEEEEEDERLNIGDSVSLEFDDIVSLGDPKF
jgi:hypothetical protein